MCIVRNRAEKASGVENADDDDNSDSELIEQLRSDKEKELKKSDFTQFLQRVSIACYAERCISYDRFCLTV